MKHEFRKTGISFSNLILQLYGDQDYRSIKSYNSPASIKKYYLKIFKSIRFAIDETIKITDKNHKDQLHETIETFEGLVKISKDFDQIDQLMISFQARLIFLLIGAMPSRWRSDKVINKRDMWGLTLHRQIQYTQTAEQKKSIIFAAVQGKYQDRFPDWGDFALKIYWRQCNNEPEKLIEWLKANHLDIYFDLF